MSRTGTTQWRKITAIIRAQGRTNNTPCHLCNGARGPIDYRTRAEADRDAKAQGAYWLLGAQRPLALDVDHITPHAQGGHDTLDNAAPTHAICNRSAGAKGAPRTKPNKPNLTPVNGYWWPLDGAGEPLPGRAIEGTQTATHAFRSA